MMVIVQRKLSRYFKYNFIIDIVIICNLNCQEMKVQVEEEVQEKEATEGIDLSLLCVFPICMLLFYVLH